MKFVYQIGRVPLFGALVNDIEIDESRDWSVKQTAFQQSSGYFTHTPVGRRMASDVDVSISGSLDSKAIGFLHTTAMLKSLGGLRDIPLIVFDMGHMPSQSPSVRWLFTTGTITKVDVKSSYGEDVSGFYRQNFSITMKIDPVWQPLLRGYWEDRPIDTRSAIVSARAGIDNIFAHPEFMKSVEKNKYFERWGDDLSKYDPGMWPYIYEKGTGYGTDWAPFRSFYVYSNDMQWAAPPVAKYVLKNLLPQGSITVTVNHEVVDYVSTLNLATLHTSLVNKGLSGLFPTDEVYFGSTAPFPSFIRRNDAILSITPVWESQSSYPGELLTGLNKITISGSDTTGKFAANIRFGSL
jgi:hypothetical protein